MQHTPKLHTTANSVQVQNELHQQLLVNNVSMLPAILQGMRTIANANAQANRNQGTQVAGGSDQNRSYRKDLSNIRCFTCGKMGHYGSFYEKPSPPPVTIHAGRVHASGALPANMVSVIEDYYLPEIEDMTFSAPAIPKKGVQKATGTRLKTKVNVPRLQRAVDQGLLENDDDGELTPVEDIDELDNVPLPSQTPHIVPPAPQILKRTFPAQQSSDNPPITRTTKTGKIRELVQSQGPKMSDPIRGKAGQSRFDVKKIFDLPLEITLGEFLDRSDITTKS